MNLLNNCRRFLNVVLLVSIAVWLGNGTQAISNVPMYFVNVRCKSRDNHMKEEVKEGPGSHALM